MRTRVITLAAALTFGVACGRPSPSPQAPMPSPSSFDTWSDQLTREWLRLSPQQATRTQYFTGDEQAALDRQLSLTGEWGNTFGVEMPGERREVFGVLQRPLEHRRRDALLRRHAVTRQLPEFPACAPGQRGARSRRCMPNGWPTKAAGTTAIRKGGSAI
jgi:hypothetical protein